MYYAFFISFAMADWSTKGEVRTTYDQISPFAVDDLQNVSYLENWGKSRIRLFGQYEPRKGLQLRVGFEALNTQLWGDETLLGQRVDEMPFRPARQNNADLQKIWPTDLSVVYQQKKWGASIGVQSFQWGLGILSNDGGSNPWFGEAEQGNHYLRASVNTALPLQSRVFLATDFVLRDDTISFYNDEQALQVISGVMHRTKRYGGGILSGIRNQIDRPEPGHPQSPTTAFIVPIDVHAWAKVSDKLVVETEWVHLRGSSNRIYSEQTRGEESEVASFGTVFRMRTLPNRKKVLRWRGIAEVGYASGDANPTDQVARSFNMHSNYNVGLILYDQIMPMLSARSVDRLIDPELMAVPPPGLRYGISQGNVSNSLYALPMFELQWKGALMRTGWLHARGMAPLSDAYRTNVYGGGYPQQHGGGEATETAMGDELLLSLRYQQPFRGIVVAMTTQGAAFLPSDALKPLFSDTIWMAHSKISIAWGGKK